MTTTALTLEALTPQHLAARFDEREAIAGARRARSRLAFLERENEDHAAEVAEKSRSGLPFLTNRQAAMRGSGSGCEIIHKACRCSKTDANCQHDPRVAPHSDENLLEAAARIEAADRHVQECGKALAEAPVSFDVFASARDEKSGYVWWPREKYVDPRRYRFRGKVLIDEDVQALGHLGLQQAIKSGGVIEVPS